MTEETKLKLIELSAQFTTAIQRNQNPENDTRTIHHEGSVLFVNGNPLDVFDAVHAHFLNTLQSTD